LTLSLAKILHGVNAFEINDNQEDEAGAALTRRSECNNVTLGWKPMNGVFGMHRSSLARRRIGASGCHLCRRKKKHRTGSFA
jgi:hypothetical protein